MDMYELAEMGFHRRGALLADAEHRVQEARWLRGQIKAGQALAGLRQLLPTAAQVWFWGPQEPGSTASIRDIKDGENRLLYSDEEGYDPGDVEDALTVATDFLTGALEDGISFSDDGEGGYRLIVWP